MKVHDNKQQDQAGFQNAVAFTSGGMPGCPSIVAKKLRVGRPLLQLVAQSSLPKIPRSSVRTGTLSTCRVRVPLVVLSFAMRRFEPGFADGDARVCHQPDHLQDGKVFAVFAMRVELGYGLWNTEVHNKEGTDADANQDGCKHACVIARLVFVSGRLVVDQVQVPGKGEHRRGPPRAIQFHPVVIITFESYELRGTIFVFAECFNTAVLYSKHAGGVRGGVRKISCRSEFELNIVGVGSNPAGFGSGEICDSFLQGDSAFFNLSARQSALISPGGANSGSYSFGKHGFRLQIASGEICECSL